MTDDILIRIRDLKTAYGSHVANHRPLEKLRLCSTSQSMLVSPSHHIMRNTGQVSSRYHTFIPHHAPCTYIGRYSLEVLAASIDFIERLLESKASLNVNIQLVESCYC